jgi:hypothetical protein
VDGSLEGWYSDPYARHEARWMSQGTPTALVRDGKTEGRDPAPEGPFTVTPVRLGDDAGPNDGVDLLRADDEQGGGPYDSDRAVRRVLDVMIDEGPIR